MHATQRHRRVTLVVAIQVPSQVAVTPPEVSQLAATQSEIKNFLAGDVVTWLSWGDVVAWLSWGACVDLMPKPDVVKLVVARQRA